ncbi:chaperonin 10-like protein [Amylocarpus encephaloides]|uniref:Chaperonin 10-like protein n=1 Tax=Amylocarpus encephaloides TaxID=45428 RepID=A0A9P8C2C0_9HELO|nr:chaperonin 10-like protein [Amylocarpus encephaloides]
MPSSFASSSIFTIARTTTSKALFNTGRSQLHSQQQLSYRTTPPVLFQKTRLHTSIPMKMTCPKETFQGIKTRKDARSAERKEELKQRWAERKESRTSTGSNMPAGTEIRKVLISAYGDESNVSVITDVIPEPAKNEVQVQVLYSGFSGSDINMRKGQYPMQNAAPLTPGYNVVGHVVANGQGSSKYQIGDTVCCLSVYEGEAELANLPEKYLIPVPEGVALKAATALILDWATAAGMVWHTAHVKSGQKVFVHGISGAVGFAIAKLSALSGAEVYGTASPKNHDAVREALPGATPFDYGNKDWIKTVKGIGGVDAVFDPIGYESWDESYSILNPTSSMLVGYGGNMSNFTGEAPRSMIPQVAKLYARNYLKFWEGRATRFYYITRDDKSFLPDIERLFELSRSGKIEVPIKQIFKMNTTEQIREAHRTWGKGKGIGSLLIQVAEDVE